MSEKRAWIDMDGTMLGLALTALAYAAAFSYEFGYTAHFGVPSSLVDVTLRSLVQSVVLLISILALAVLLQLILVHLIEALLKAKVPLVVSMFITGAILCAIVAALFNLEWGYWATAGAFVLVAVVHLVAPAFTHKKIATYAEKLAAHDARMRASLTPPSAPWFTGTAMLVVLLTAAAIKTAQDAGRSEARKQRQFLVANVSPACLIVRAYGDTLICAQYEAGKLRPKFRLLSKLDQSLELELRRIGPFQPIPNNDELMPGRQAKRSDHRSETGTRRPRAAEGSKG